MNFIAPSRWLLLALSLVVSGCATLSPKVDPTRYYVLKGTSSGRLTNKAGLVVGVGPVVIPGYLDHKEMVTAGPGGDLRLAEYEIWAEPLDEAVARVVAKNLSGLMGSPGIVPFPDADADYDYKVGIVVRRFEMGADNKVRLEASYSISGRPGSDFPGRSNSRTVTRTVKQPELHASIADTMSAALADLSSTIARDLIKLD